MEIMSRLKHQPLSVSLVSPMELFIDEVRLKLKKCKTKVKPIFVCPDQVIKDKCKSRWLSMTDTEKLYFVRKAFQMKKKSRISTKVPRKRKKLSTLPKRAVSSYVKFCQEEREHVVEDLLHASFGEVSRELSRRWSALPQELRQKYDQLAAEDRKRYNEEKAQMSRSPSVSPELPLADGMVKYLDDEVVMSGG